MGLDHDEEGQFTSTASEETVLALVTARNEPVFTGDVADELDCSNTTARKRLTSLHKQGKINRRKKGRISVWWMMDEDAVNEDPETALRRLSKELGAPITVEETVYEDGDMHPLSDANE